MTLTIGGEEIAMDFRPVASQSTSLLSQGDESEQLAHSLPKSVFKQLWRKPKSFDTKSERKLPNVRRGSLLKYHGSALLQSGGSLFKSGGSSLKSGVSPLKSVGGLFKSAGGRLANGNPRRGLLQQEEEEEEEEVDIEERLYRFSFSLPPYVLGCFALSWELF